MTTFFGYKSILNQLIAKIVNVDILPGNQYSVGLVQNELTMDVLFEE